MRWTLDRAVRVQASLRSKRSRASEVLCVACERRFWSRKKGKEQGKIFNNRLASALEAIFRKLSARANLLALSFAKQMTKDESPTSFTSE